MQPAASCYKMGKGGGGDIKNQAKQRRCRVHRTWGGGESTAASVLKEQCDEDAGHGGLDGRELIVAGVCQL